MFCHSLTGILDADINRVASCIGVIWFGKGTNLIKSSLSLAVSCLLLIQVSSFTGLYEPCSWFVTVWGYLVARTDGLEDFQAITPIYLWSVFAFNILVTTATGNPLTSFVGAEKTWESLIAGRIWWMARISRSVLGNQLVRSYNIAIAILSVISLFFASLCDHNWCL